MVCPISKKERMQVLIEELEKQGYPIGKKIGNGALGEVYHVLREKGQSPKVVKFFFPIEGHAKKIDREIKNLSYVTERNAPHLPRQVYQAYNKNYVASVQEYAGKRLSEKSLQAFSTKEKLYRIQMIATQALEALAFFHRRGGFHGDVNPTNCCYNEKNGEFTLIDLESCCLEGEEYRYIGTPGYISPERYKGDEIGPSQDVWGLACVLWELFVGEIFVDGMEGGMEMRLFDYWQTLQRCDKASSEKFPPERFSINFVQENPIEEKKILENFKALRKEIGEKENWVDSLNKKGKELEGEDRKIFRFFCSFLEGALQWDPEKRSIVETLRNHKFLLIEHMKSWRCKISYPSEMQVSIFLGDKKREDKVYCRSLKEGKKNRHCVHLLERKEGYTIVMHNKEGKIYGEKYVNEKTLSAKEETPILEEEEKGQSLQSSSGTSG